MTTFVSSVYSYTRRLPPERSGWWIVVLLIGGYVTLGRSFAYVGVPEAKVFIGEVALAAFLMFRGRYVWNAINAAFSRPSPINAVLLAMGCFIGYGAFSLCRAIVLEYPPLTALQNFAFNLYCLYFLTGIWVGTVRPDLLRNFLPTLAWIHGLYGVAYTAGLSEVWVRIPGTDVNIFGQPGGASLFIFGLLCFRPASRIHFYGPLLLNALVLLGIQVRAEWLSFCVALPLWGILARRIRSLVAGAAFIVVLLCVGLATDARLPGVQSRGGDVSARALIGRVISPIDPDLANDFNPNSAGYAGTVRWRTKWWAAIWDAVHSRTESMLFGFSYGYPIGNLVSYLRGQVIRTPHNIFYFNLVYGGWCGVAVFAALQLTLGWLMWQSYRATNQPFGLLVWIKTLTEAFFGNILEAPFGAIPFYLLIGICAVPVLRSFRRVSQPARAAVVNSMAHRVYASHR